MSKVQDDLPSCLYEGVTHSHRRPFMITSRWHRYLDSYRSCHQNGTDKTRWRKFTWPCPRAVETGRGWLGIAQFALCMPLPGGLTIDVN